jgi:hypothetical protein
MATDFDDFREVGAATAWPVSARDENVEDDLVAEWRGRWDEF